MIQIWVLELENYEFEFMDKLLNEIKERNKSNKYIPFKYQYILVDV